MSKQGISRKASQIVDQHHHIKDLEAKIFEHLMLMKNFKMNQEKYRLEESKIIPNSQMMLANLELSTKEILEKLDRDLENLEMAAGRHSKKGTPKQPKPSHESQSKEATNKLCAVKADKESNKEERNSEQMKEKEECEAFGEHVTNEENVRQADDENPQHSNIKSLPNGFKDGLEEVQLNNIKKLKDELGQSSEENRVKMKKAKEKMKREPKDKRKSKVKVEKTHQKKRNAKGEKSSLSSPSAVSESTCQYIDETFQSQTTSQHSLINREIQADEQKVSEQESENSPRRNAIVKNACSDCLPTKPAFNQQEVAIMQENTETQNKTPQSVIDNPIKNTPPNTRSDLSEIRRVAPSTEFLMTATELAEGTSKYRSNLSAFDTKKCQGNHTSCWSFIFGSKKV